MPFVKSRVNGLKIAIPNDARGVIHRFAIGGGGNELVFDPQKRKDYEASRALDSKPVTMGGPEAAPDDDDTDTTLTVNVVDDEEEAPKPRRRSRAKPKADTEEPKAEEESIL